jgi:hypothetical protein
VVGPAAPFGSLYGAMQGEMSSIDASQVVMPTGPISIGHPPDPAPPPECGKDAAATDRKVAKCNTNCGRNFDVCMGLTVINGILASGTTLGLYTFFVGDMIAGCVLEKWMCEDYCESMGEWCRGDPDAGVFPGSGRKPANPWIIGNPWPR